MGCDIGLRAKMMGNTDDGCIVTFAVIVENLKAHYGMVRIHGRGRFIEKDQPWPGDHCAREPDALSLARRERGVLTIPKMGEVEPGEDLGDRMARFEQVQWIQEG